MALLISQFLLSCGSLPKEGKEDWIEIQLQLGSSQKIKRSGTDVRGSEFAIVVPAATKFSEQGPAPTKALNWNKVNLTSNTVTLLLPTNEDLQLLVYRYTEDHSLFDLEQRLFGRALHLNSIEFGKSELFSISNTNPMINVFYRVDRRKGLSNRAEK